MCRFLHPIVYGEYPKTIQNIVGNRLPKFTQEEVKIVKGSIDFVGINQYTTYYMFDPHQPKPKYLGYQQDWNCGFACKNTLPPPSTHTQKKKKKKILYAYFTLLAKCGFLVNSADEKNGVSIGPRVICYKYIGLLQLINARLS